jgi:hypothetical protein
VPLGAPREPGVWGRHGGRRDGGATQQDDRLIGLDNGGRFRRRRRPRGMAPPSRWTGSRCPARRYLSSCLSFIAALFARVSWCSLSRPATPKIKGWLLRSPCCCSDNRCCHSLRRHSRRRTRCRSSRARGICYAHYLEFRLYIIWPGLCIKQGFYYV